MKKALVCLIVGFVLMFIGRMGMGRKPSADSLKNPVAKAPLQTNFPIAHEPIAFAFEGANYRLFPQAQYQMQGLVVSQHRSDSLFDLAHKRVGDTFNSRDICTVWGSMLTNGTYEELDFWSGDWTCYFKYGPSFTSPLNLDEFANTHMVANNPDIRKKLAEIEVGDEIVVKGQLVDYELGGIGRRKTSLVRTDREAGACEILFVESVEIIKSHNRTYRHVRFAGSWLALLSGLTIIGIMVRAVFFSSR